MRKRVTTMVLCVLPFSGSFSQVAPGGVPNAKLWLRADQGVEVINGNQVVRWNNQSSPSDILIEADTVAQNTAHILLTNDILNFNKALSFDGLDTAYLRGMATVGFNSESTMFVVCRLNNLPNPTGETLLGIFTSRNADNGGGGQGISVGGNTVDPYYLIDGQGAQRNRTSIVSTSANELVLITGIYTDGSTTLNSTIFKNESVTHQYIGVDPASVSPDCRLFEIGGRSFNFQRDRAFFGDIAEVIYYPFVLADSDIKKIDSYLALKYGVTLAHALASNYVSSNGTVIWQGNADFQHAIFGIGMDAASLLSISQSNSMVHGSGNGTGQVGQGNIVIGNASSLDNQDFLIIGDNNALLSEQTSELPADPVFTGKMRLGREWRVQKTGDIGTVDLSFETTGLSLSGNLINTVLLISEGDENFATGPYRYYITPTLNGNILNYSGITLNNNDYFTFLTNLQSPLPVELTGFSASVCGNSVCLQWQTASENNNDRFEIERSSDGRSFHVIGTVTGAGTTSVTQQHSFEDQNPLSGFNYYRLKQVDIDGEIKYSQVRRININRNDTFKTSVYPNPANHVVNIMIEGLKLQENILIEIVNVKGLVMHKEQCIAGGTSMNKTLQRTKLTNGVYLYRVTRLASREIFVGKFVLQ